VQKILEDALTLIIGERISVTGAGRTDTGVHARFFCAHIDSSYEDLDSRKNLLFRINKFLPRDISINSIKKVVPDAHARFSAVSRTYQYLISRSKDPFLEGSAWYLYGDLDTEAMNSACRILMQHTDFTSFSKLHTDVKTNNCRIFHAEWKEERSLLVFTIKADRFLRNMVRAIVGTMADVGQGKTSLEEFGEIILSHDRCRAGQSAPAAGLFLTDIEYPEEIFIP
jgi:tRNA pseudouridine38-40 synthase